MLALLTRPAVDALVLRGMHFSQGKWPVFQQMMQVSGVEIAATAMLDHPTPRAIASHLVGEMLGATAAERQASGPAATPATLQLSVQAVTSLWPAGCAGKARGEAPHADAA